jgi:NADH-quinone oxidoreductase subunit G
VLGVRLPYDSLDGVRARLAEASPVFAGRGFAPHGCTDTAGPAGDPAAVSDAGFVPPVDNYWQADVISRASATMAECARTYLPQAAE